MSGTPGLTPLLNTDVLAPPSPPSDNGPTIIAQPIVIGALQPWVDLRLWLANNQTVPNASSGLWDPTAAFNWYIELDGTTFVIPSVSGSPWIVKTPPDGYTFNLCVINGLHTPGDITWGPDWILSTVLVSGFIAANPVGTRSVISVVCLNTLHLSDDNLVLQSNFSNPSRADFLCSGPTILPPA